MRIGVIGPVYDDSLAENILVTLEQMGHETVALGSPGFARGRASSKLAELGRRLGAEAEQVTQRAVVTRASKAECDIIISVLPNLMPNVVTRLKASTSRVALWYQDAVANVGRMAMAVAPWDALFMKDAWLAERLHNVYGLPAVYLPEACNPLWHHPVGRFGTNPHIVVIGSVYPTRARLLERLLTDRIPLRLYGSALPRWLPDQGLSGVRSFGYIAREAKAEAFRGARGVLNNLHPGEMVSVNCRLFEAAASGGAVLCERREGLRDVFDEPGEVLGFSSYDELLQHCQVLLEDASVGRAVGDAAAERARRDHSYEARLTVMLRTLAA